MLHWVWGRSESGKSVARGRSFTVGEILMAVFGGDRTVKMGAVRVSFGEGISSQPESGPSQVMSGTPLRRRSFRRGGNTAHIGESPTGEATARVWARLLPGALLTD